MLKTMKSSSLLLIALMVAVLLSGCETIKGLGKDIENTGRNISDGFSQSK